MIITFEGSILASSLGAPAFGDGIASFYFGGELRLIYDIMPTGNVGQITLGASAVSGFSFAADGDFATVDTGQDLQIYSFTGPGSTLRSASLLGDGSLSASRIVTVDSEALLNVMDLSSYTVSGGNFVALSQWRTQGLSTYEVGPDGNLALMSNVADTRKSYLRDVSDTLTIDVAGTTYLVTASAGENGVTLFRTMPNGSLEFHDSIGMNDGLPVNGLTAIAATEAWGNDYLVLGSTLTSSVSLVRVNAMGVMFLEDHLLDTLDTRFRSLAALDTFSVQGRTFVVAAGNDAGITVLEILPDGGLLDYRTFISDEYSPIGTVTGLEAVVTGTDAHFYLLQATRTQILDFKAALATVGGVIYGVANTAKVGTANDDLMIGSSGADDLRGGNGNDTLIDGDGADALRGNGGNDVFILVEDAWQDRIIDFQNGSDRIDVSRWAGVRTFSDLEIISLATGAEVRHGDDSLLVYSSNGRPLDETNFTADDFIF